MGKKTGPKPGDHEKRTKLCGFYLTPTDWIKLDEAAKKGGFKSTSSLITAIVEPVVQGGLSVRSAARAVSRIQKFMEGNGLKFRVDTAALGEALLGLFTAPPPIVPEEIEDLSQLKADLRALLAELENQTTTNTSK